MAFRRKYRRKRLVRRIRRKKPSKKLVKTIQRVINKNAESKIANFNTGNTLLAFNSGINLVTDMRQVLPNIAKGTSVNERAGDQLMCQSLVIKGYIKANIQSTAGVPSSSTILVRLMVVSLKTRSNYSDASASSSPLNSLIRKGGTTTTFAGNISDINAELNTEIWTKHYDRKFYLTQDFLVTAAGNNNVKNTVKFFNIRLKCRRKLLKYDDSISSGLLPTNYGPMLMVGYSYMDGAAPDTGTNAVGIYYDVDMTYQDL